MATARDALEQDLRTETASSAAVAIIEDGMIVYSETFGLADRENKIPVREDTLFNIGSISKAFTASAIMALVDEGKVELDAPVSRYLPEFAMADPRFVTITVRMLLNHTSGIPCINWENGMGFETDPEYARTTLRKLKTQRLKFDPGAVATYCNDGFTLAELVVERVSGMSFIDYVAQHDAAGTALRRETAERLGRMALRPRLGLGGEIAFKEAGIEVLGKGGNTGRYTSQILVAPS